MRRTRRTAAALAITALTLAGCGGDGDEETATEPLTRAEYQQAILGILRDDGAPLISLYTDLVVGPAPAAQCAEGMQELEGHVDDLLDDVAALAPPEDVASIQEKFLAEAGTSAEEVSAVAERVEAGEVSCGRELNDLLYGMPSSVRAGEAIAELETHGYVVLGR